jgi:hypothetical protein
MSMVCSSAYERHHGKHLLTEFRWEYVVSKHIIPGEETLGKKANNPRSNKESGKNFKQ